MADHCTNKTNDVEDKKIDKQLDLAIENYWGPVFRYDYSLDLETQRLEYQKSLEGKYGKKVMDQFRKNDKNWPKLNGLEKDAAIKFLYDTGIYRDVSPTYSLEGLEVLKMLAKNLKHEPKIKICDLGSGAGEIGIGLALRLENVERIYLIEHFNDAVKKSRENITNLNHVKQNQNTLERKISVFEKDYLDDDFVKTFNTEYPSDVLLFNRPDRPENAIIGIDLLGITNNNINNRKDSKNQSKKIYTTLGIGINEEQAIIPLQDILTQNVYELNMYIRTFGASFKLLDSKWFTPRNAILFGEISIF